MRLPSPLSTLVIALLLLALCVIIHALVVTLLFRWFRRLELPDDASFLRSLWILVQVAWWTVLAHLLDMAIWALAYLKIGALPDFDTAVYFSMVTYTTVGYGDVVLPPGWQVLAGIEGLTGILMAGWSTALLFGVVNRLLSPTGRSKVRHGAGPS